MYDSLLQQAREHGYDITEIKLRDKIERFKTKSKPNHKNGWYIAGELLPTPGKPKIGILTIGDWETGEKHTFTTAKYMDSKENIYIDMAIKRHMEEFKKQREKDYKPAALVANRNYLASEDIDPEFEYFKNKKIVGFKGLSQLRMTSTGKLLIPMFSGESIDDITSHQTIDTDGEKRFLPDGKVSGSYFKLASNSDLDVLSKECIICEGVATGITIFHALDGNVDVVIAFNANNLFPVCEKIVKLYGTENVRILADDDRYNGINPGEREAKKCVDGLGVRMLLPDFSKFGYESKPTDFNDLLILGGIKEVTYQIQTKPSDLIVSMVGNTASGVGSLLTEDPPTPEPCSLNMDEYQHLLENGFYLNVLVNGKQRHTPQFEHMATYFRDVLKCRFEASGIYYYNGRFYEEISKDAVEAKIGPLLKDNFNKAIDSRKYSSFFTAIKSCCHESGLQPLIKTAGKFFNFQNGVYDLDNNQLLPHSHIYDFISIRNVNYNPSAKCPKWIKTLADVSSNNEGLIKLQEQIIGYTLMGGRAKSQHAFFDKGNGGNGKSLVNEIRKMIIGHGNYSNLSLKDLENRFSIGDLNGMMANFSADASNDEVDSGIFKRLVAGDEVFVDVKNKEGYSMIPTARFFVSINDFPRFMDSSYGSNRRLVFIPYKKTFKGGENNENLLDELRAEEAGIFNWALDALREFKAGGEKFIVVKEVEDEKEEKKADECVIFRFVRDLCVLSAEPFNEAIKIGDLYKDYEDYFLDQRSLNFKIKDKYIFGKKVGDIIRAEFGYDSVFKDRKRFLSSYHIRKKDIHGFPISGHRSDNNLSTIRGGH